MGKPYRSEIEHLNETYAWAHALEVADFSDGLRSSLAFPLVAIGSGGSLTTAHFAAKFHQQYSGHLARAMTPLEATTTRRNWREVAVMFLTAGGSNPDIVGSFREIVRREPAFLGVFCCRPESRLVREAARHRYVNQFLLSPPTGKDGFLATNTLLGSAVALARSYGAAADCASELPPDLDQILGDWHTGKDHQEVVREFCRPLWERNTLTVLYGPHALPGAVDLESKFVEAALGDIQIADFRNFAHGRHQWLARRGASTGVLALVGRDDTDLADGTLKALPTSVPVVRFDLPGTGPAQAIAALVRGFSVAGFAGEARGIDPGSPRVPDFGRRLYHLDAYRSRSRRATPDEIRVTAVERKSRCWLADTETNMVAEGWRAAFEGFRANLLKARFKGIVLDYDGTLCEPRDRLAGLPPDIVAQLIRLLRLKIPVGIATGRGCSVGRALRDALPENVWDYLVVGYYNGSDIAPLADQTRPDKHSPAVTPLEAIHRSLAQHLVISRIADLTLRPQQLTVERIGANVRRLVWSTVVETVEPYLRFGVRAVASSHSIDVLAPGVTKRAVVEEVRKMGQGKNGPILCAATASRIRSQRTAVGTLSSSLRDSDGCH